MEKFLTLTVSGAVSGAIFSLIAAGLVLSYSATGIFNFSYGAIAFTSAFLYYQLNSGLHWPIVPAAVFVILVFAPLFGLLLDVGVFRPLARATESAKIMATVGLLIAIPALTTWLNDQLVNTVGFVIPRSGDVTQVGLPPAIGPSPKVDWKLPGDIPFDSNQLVVFISAVVVAVGLWLLMRHTTLGLQMRAVVDRPPLASTRGINERTTSRVRLGDRDDAGGAGRRRRRADHRVAAPGRLHHGDVRGHRRRGARRAAIHPARFPRRAAPRHRREPGGRLRRASPRTSAASTARSRSSCSCSVSW